ncbi:envelope protein UL43 [Falconid herpesvirus 1]|uniref:Envelope protein UL43 n=1 Tax=Falconid herpesvirus 1 TaxID=1510155 RepID=A0A068EPL0_9ALPH|nr:envelope protein UL43 [Falconid herpesvirus 1]AID52748.1 envelope protein UL43 [Falconid herpesvirus 1]
MVIPFWSTTPLWLVVPTPLICGLICKNVEKSLMRTCYWKRGRFSAGMRPSVPVGKGIGRDPYTNEVLREEAVKCWPIILNSVGKVAVSFMMVFSIPAVCALQFIMSDKSLAGDLVTAELGVSIFLGSTIAGLVPVKMASVCLCMVLGVAIWLALVGMALAACGLSPGPMLYIITVTVISAVTVNEVRQDSKGVRMLAASFVERSLVGFLMLSVSASGIITWAIHPVRVATPRS